MTHARTHPRLRRLLTRLVLEIGISLFVVVSIVLIAQWRSVSTWLMIAFTGCNAFFLFNNVLGYYFLRKRPAGETIRGTIHAYHLRMKKMLMLSNVAGCVMSLFLMAANFFLLDDAADRFIFSMLLAPLTLFCFWRADQWRSRATEVRKMLREFDQ